MMPPKFNIPEEAIEQLAAAMSKAGSKEISTKAITVTVASALAVLGFAISSTWFVAQRLSAFDNSQTTLIARVETLSAEFKNGKDRWKISYEAEEMREFQRMNPALNLQVPNPYKIKADIGE